MSRPREGSAAAQLVAELRSPAARTRQVDGGIVRAKRCLQTCPAAQWNAKGRSNVAIKVTCGDGTVQIGSGTAAVILSDNATRAPLLANDFGDDLPSMPVVLLGVADDWRAVAPGGGSGGWSAASLAARGCGSGEPLFGVDGGPAWARNSLAAPAVTMQAYAEYCSAGAEGDDAPLYVFDSHIATRTFADGQPLMAECGPAPACFRHDTMAGLGGLRPLPPTWLLVAAARSGTPIHDHPHTVAWNVLFSGSKLWAILPPGATDLAEDQGSALGWFLRHGAKLPKGAVVVVQRPGETVFVPAGWWHVVLNCEDSAALSSSLALRRDFTKSLGALEKEDPVFAAAWLSVVEPGRC